MERIQAQISPTSILLINCDHHKDFFLSDICPEIECPRRLLCLKCKESHDPGHLAQTIPIIQLFGNYIEGAIEEAKEAERKIEPYSSEFFYNEIDLKIDRINNLFSKFIEKAKEELYEHVEHLTKVSHDRYKQSFTNWDELKAEYDNCFSKLFESNIKNSNKELENFIACHRIINQRLTRSKSTKILHDSIILNEELYHKLIITLKTELSLFSEKFISLKQIPNPINFGLPNLRLERKLPSEHKQGIGRQALIDIPNFNFFVTAGKDGNITLWDSLKIKEYQILEEVHKSWIYSLAYAEKKNILFTASADMTIKALKISPKGVDFHLGTMRDHQKSVHGLLVVEKENFLLSCGDDPDIRIWSLDDLRLVGRIETEKGEMGCSMAFIPRLNAVAVGIKEEGLVLFNIKSKKRICTVKTGSKSTYINCIRYIEAKNWLISEVSFGKIRIWEPKEKLIHLKDIDISGEYPGSFLLFDQIEILVVAGGTSFISVVDIKNKNKEGKFEIGNESCNSVLYLPKSSKIIVAERDTDSLSVISCS